MPFSLWKSCPDVTQIAQRKHAPAVKMGAKRAQIVNPSVPSARDAARIVPNNKRTVSPNFHLKERDRERERESRPLAKEKEQEER